MKKNLILKKDLVSDNKDLNIVSNTKAIFKDPKFNGIFSDECKDKSEFINDLRTLKATIRLLIMYKDKTDNLEKLSVKFAEDFLTKYDKFQPFIGDPSSWIPQSYPNHLVQAIMKNESKRISSLAYKQRKILKEKHFDTLYVSHLKNILEKYFSYIETFSWIDRSSEVNYLDKSNYIISPILKDALCSKSNNIKTDQWIYLFMFTIINNKGKSVLVYNSIKYPSIFEDTLLYYMCNRSNLLTDCLSITDFKLDFKPDLNINHLTNLRKYINIYPKNLIDFINMLVGHRPVFINLDSMYNIISYFIKKDVNNIVYEIVSSYDCDDKDKNVIKSILEKSSLTNYYFLDKCIFIVKDGDNFIKNIKNTINSDINQGINKLKKGQINSLINTLSNLDTDFRNSLYRHNIYHHEQGNINKNDLIPRNKFDFKNIHNKLGDVPW